MLLDVDFLFKVTGGAGGIVGSLLGVYNLIHSRRKEKREERDREAAKQEAELEWQLFSGLHEASKEGFIYVPPGDAELRRAERLVERGVLERLPKGAGYAIPG